MTTCERCEVLTVIVWLLAEGLQDLERDFDALKAKVAELEQRPLARARPQHVH